MGTSLVLEVSEEEQSKRVIHEYYEYVQQKERAVSSDTDESRVEDRPDYKLVLNRFEKDGKFYIWEQLFRDISLAVGWENVVELFNAQDDETDYTIKEREDLKHLTKLLREAKATLKEERPEKNWEATFETQVIALCEFALENGYGIRISY